MNARDSPCVKPDAFGPHVLDIDAPAEVARITEALRRQLRADLRKRGLVLGLSGGNRFQRLRALARRRWGERTVFCLFHARKRFRSREPRPRPARGPDLRARSRDRGYRPPPLDAMGCYRRRDGLHSARSFRNTGRAGPARW